MDAIANAVVIPQGQRGHYAWKRRPRPQLLVRDDLDSRTNAAKAFDKLASDIAGDLGGADRLTQLERRLIEGFVGASIMVEAMNCRMVLGEKVDLNDYCQVASTMTRIASRLGLSRRPKDIGSSLGDILKANPP
jgi:hypothetical protein